jgi:hypothetical protein
MIRMMPVLILAFALFGVPARGAPRDMLDRQATTATNTVRDLRDLCRDVPRWRDAAADEAAYARVLSCLGYVRGAVDLYRSFERWNGVHVLCIDQFSVFDLVDGFLTTVDPVDVPDDDPALYLVATIKARHGCR